MPKQAKSSFTLDKRDTTPAEWQGGQLARARWTKVFSGELAGSSVLEGVMLGLDGGTARVYVAVERIDCTLHERKGSFVLLHSATQNGASAATSWTIVPGSGTGELSGIRGEGQITPTHEFVLSYDLD